jgi:hypothetical protein
MTGAERVARWRERHPERARAKAREADQRYRERRRRIEEIVTETTANESEKSE